MLRVNSHWGVRSDASLARLSGESKDSRSENFGYFKQLIHEFFIGGS